MAVLIEQIVALGSSNGSVKPILLFQVRIRSIDARVGDIGWRRIVQTQRVQTSTHSVDRITASVVGRRWQRRSDRRTSCDTTTSGRSLSKRLSQIVTDFLII